MKKLVTFLSLTILFASFGLQAQFVSSNAGPIVDQLQKTKLSAVAENFEGKAVQYTISSLDVKPQIVKLKVDISSKNLPVVSLPVSSQQYKGIIASEVSAQNAATSGNTLIKLGGCSVYLDGTNLQGSDAYSLYNYVVGDKSSATVMPSPYFGINSGPTWGLSATYAGAVYAAAWDGAELISQIVFYDRQTGRVAYLGPYARYNPVTQSLKSIGSGALEGGKLFADMTYDKVSKKVWAVWGTYLFSNSGKDTIFTLVDTLKVNGHPMPGAVKGIATNANGNTFIVAVDGPKGTLYRVNTATAALTLVGELGIAVGSYKESATFDMYTNTLYYQNSVNKEYICTVDTLTGAATLVDHIGSETTALFHYYHDVPPPKIPTDLTVEKNSSNYLEHTLSWRNPVLNYNETPLVGLTKVYIYRGTGLGDMVKIDSVNTTEPGEFKSYVTEATEGKFYYGVQALAGELVSPIASSDVVMVYPTKNLPYQTSFETPLDRGILALGVGSERVEDYPYTGQFAWRLTGENTGAVEINTLPLKKGAQYKITFMGRIVGSSAPGYNNFAYFVNNLGAYKAIVDTVYRKYEVIHLATEDGEAGLSFASMNTVGAKYMDDVTVEVYATEEAPNKIDSLISVLPDPKGDLTYTTTWYNPSLTSGDKALANLTHMIVERSTRASFSSSANCYRVDTVPVDVVGGKVTMDFSVPIPGKYYFRFRAKNQHGISPFYTSSPEAAWVGKDTLPAAVSGINAVANNDATATISWDAHSGVGSNGGYLDGRITKYRVITTYYYNSSTGANRAPDTGYTENLTFTTPALQKGMYRFYVAPLRNDLNYGISASVFTVSGLQTANKLISRNSKPIRAPQSHAYPLSISIMNNQSAFSQLLFTADEMGGPCLIDTIYLFNTNVNSALKTSIYLGTKGSGSDTTFRTTSDWVDKSSGKLVFNDTITTVNSENTIAIPITPYYYDGKSSLVMTFVKPKQGTNKASSTLYGLPTPGRVMGQVSNAIDFDAVNYPPMAGAPNLILRSITVVNNKVDAAKITGTVKNGRNGKLVNAKLTVKVGDEVYTTTTTDVDGAYLLLVPAGTYTVVVSAMVMAEHISSYTFTAGENKTLDFVLLDAEKISLTGTIVNPKKEGIPNLRVELKGDTTYSTTTNAQGVFTVASIYGATTYSITAEGPEYKNLISTITLADENYTVDTLIMDYSARPVNTVVAAVASNVANITWNAPGAINVLSWNLRPTATNAVGAGGSKMLCAQMFKPEDFVAAGLSDGTGKITKVKFRNGSANAVFELKIYQGSNPDTTTAKYRQKIGLCAVGAVEVVLTTPYAFDPTKDMYVSLEIADGYGATFPMGCDNGPIKVGQGAKIYYEGTWEDLTALEPTLTFNWDIYTTIEAPLGNQPIGYNVYRGLLETEESVDAWTKLNATPLTTLTYADNDFAALPFGQYKYAVKADWMNNNLSAAVFSNVLNKDMELAIQAQVNTNGAPKTNATVVFANVDGKESHRYTVKAPASGLISIPKLWRGTYDIFVELPGHEKVEIKDVEIEKDTLISLPTMIETILNPRITSVEVVENTAALNWTMLSEDSWFDDFESYDDFAIADIGNYTLSTPVRKGAVAEYLWPNLEKEQSYIVMNPNKTSPSSVSVFPAHSGSKYLASWYTSPNPPNDDWLIREVSPDLDGGKLSFYARGKGYEGIPESFRVLYSTKTSAIADFVTAHSVPSVDAAFVWAPYAFNIPADAKYIAVNCVSNDLFGFFLDDLSFISGFLSAPKSFEIYLNETKVAEVGADVSTYMLKDLSPGVYTVGVKAIFHTGTSTLGTKEITISTVAKPVNPSVSMNAGNAVFTWDIPSGYNPSSYEVYLDSTKVADAIEKTYTFVAPPIGAHTAGVVAVFGAEKSAMTTVSFNVLKIDDFAANAGILVYPNPSSSGQFNLVVRSSFDISVMQYNGQVIKTMKVVAGENVVDLSTQPQGIYFIRLNGANETYTIKIVK